MLDDDQWHDVKIIREQKNLNISVDRIKVWRNISAIFLHMNMNRNLSVGGLPDFSNRRGVSVSQNFIGCIEEFIFNGVHIIRDAQRSLMKITQSQTANGNLEIPWEEALGYPKRNSFLWWGPPVTEEKLNISGLAIGGSGVIGTECPGGVIDNTVLTFPDVQQYIVFLKIERDGGTNVLQFEFGFRSLNRGGILFYHTVDKDNNYISVSLYCL
ncbi:unnamed protein product [Trichobilharzia regenti]|nr:unnamed protein product [Trichobilharzia regenti]